MDFYRIDNISSRTDFDADFPAYGEAKRVETTTESADKKSGKGMSFGDILDIVNPLQHVPIVSTVYRTATGDDISPVSRLLGGALFGQIFGFIAAAVNVVVEAVTGKDIGDHVMTALKGEYKKFEAVASSESERVQTQLLSMSKNKNESSQVLDAPNQVTYSEGIKKYEETKEILESKNYLTETATSIVV